MPCFPNSLYFFCSPFSYVTNENAFFLTNIFSKHTASHPLRLLHNISRELQHNTICLQSINRIQSISRMWTSTGICHWFSWCGSSQWGTHLKMCAHYLTGIILFFDLLLCLCRLAILRWSSVVICGKFYIKGYRVWEFSSRELTGSGVLDMN